jgi:hypothetical protein
MKRIFLGVGRERSRVQDGIVMIAFMDIASDDDFRGRGSETEETQRENPFEWSRRVLGIISGVGWEETVVCMIEIERRAIIKQLDVFYTQQNHT